MTWIFLMLLCARADNCNVQNVGTMRCVNMDRLLSHQSAQSFTVHFCEVER